MKTSFVLNMTGFSDWTEEWQYWMLGISGQFPTAPVLCFSPDEPKLRSAGVLNLFSFDNTADLLNWLATHASCLINLVPAFEPKVSPIPSLLLLPVFRPSPFWSAFEGNQLGVWGDQLIELALRTDVTISNSRELLDLFQRLNPYSQKLHEFNDFQSLTDTELNRWIQKAKDNFNHIAVSIETTPLVSIVTPSFNQGKFIGKSLNSVFTQTYQNIEYFVIDGGSKDHSIQVLNEYQGKLNWLSEKDSGYPEAVNKGFQKCSGEYLMWLPSDDMLFSENSVAHLVKTAVKSGADVVFGDAFYIDQNDRLMGHYRTECYTPERLREWCLICQPATLFKADLFKKIGGLDQSFRCISDYDLWLRMSEAGAQFVRIGTPISCYRIHGDSLTVKQKNISYREIFDLQVRRYKTVRRSWVLGAFKEVVLQQNLPAIWKSTNKNGVARSIFLSNFAKKLIRRTIESYLANNPYFQKFIRRRIEPRESIWGRGR